MVYLFGFMEDDFMGRVVVAPVGQTIERLAQQLTAWGLAPEAQGAFTVTNESGAVLDTSQTIAQAGLGNGDIFTVDRSA
jgi:hypothetical protein